MDRLTANETESDSDGDLTALLGSRICHDLISPLGAIGNGVELLMMSGAAGGPEIALISQSVQSANARIRFFRLAFGSAADHQQVARAEVVSVLDDMTGGGRLRLDWQAGPTLGRVDVKIAFLAIMCFETALPYGGQLRITASGADWTLQADAERMKIDPALWSRLARPPQAPTPGSTLGPTLAPAHVQFALLVDAARRFGRLLRLDLADTRITLRF